MNLPEVRHHSLISQPAAASPAIDSFVIPTGFPLPSVTQFRAPKAADLVSLPIVSLPCSIQGRCEDRVGYPPHPAMQARVDVETGGLDIHAALTILAPLAISLTQLCSTTHGRMHPVISGGAL